MANFKTGAFNTTAPIKLRDWISGRLIKENEGLVNFADWIEQIVTIGSGVNVNVSSGMFTGNSITINELIGGTNSKVVFSADFNGGFDTIFDWVGIGRNNLSYDILPEERNLTFVDSNDPENTLVPDTNSARLLIASNTGSDDGTLYTWQSRNPIKMDETGYTVSFAPGVYRNISLNDNVESQSITVQSPIDGADTIPQSLWNVDNFDGTGSAQNPSGIEIGDVEWMKLQCLVAIYPNKTRGDAILGLLIDNNVYFAHRVKVYNQTPITSISQQLPYGNNNLPFKEEVLLDSGKWIRKTGLISATNGLWFNSVMDLTNEPSMLMEQFAFSPVIYSVGSDKTTRYKPFVASRQSSFLTVEAGVTFDVILLGIRSTNLTLWTFDEIKVTATGPNLDHGVNILVVYNPALSSGDFNNIPLDGSEIEFSTNAVLDSGGHLLYAGYVYATQTAVITKNSLLEQFTKEFSKKTIQYNDGATTQELTKDDTITVMVNAIDTMPMNSLISVSATVEGGEKR